MLWDFFKPEFWNLGSLFTFLVFQPRSTTVRRVEALYDCQADHHDELSFSEGQVLVVLGQEDSDWWVCITIVRSDCTLL